MISAHCPTGWIYMFNNCYYFSTDQQTWNSADAYCVSAGATLASIHSAAENNFLVSKSVYNFDF